MPTVPTVLTVLPVPMAIFVACHKKKKMLTPKKTNKTPKKKKASKKKPLKVNPGGQPEGKKNYTWAETLHMLDILEDVLPVCMEEWKVVKARHAEAWSGTHRDVPSLKRKYNVLHRLQIPTGDPNMPDKV